MSDLIQAVVGFRSWQTDDGLLRSNGAGKAIWDPDVTVAECEGYDKVGNLWWFGEEPKAEASPHPAPAKDCGCGLYAYHQPRKPSDGLLAFSGSKADVIHGAIAAWGRMEVHASGFRAEKARVVALVLDDRCITDKARTAQIEALATTYGAKAVPPHLFVDEARQHGIPVPKEMLPEEEEQSPLYSDLMRYHKQLLYGSPASNHYSHTRPRDSLYHLYNQYLFPPPEKKGGLFKWLK